jgi:hypothetical protein
LLLLSACSVPQTDVTPIAKDTSSPNPQPEKIGADTNPWVAYLINPDYDTNLWNVEPCESNAPFLCVSDAQKNPVGTIELQTWLLEQRPDFVAALGKAGLDAMAIDVDDPAQQPKIQVALKTLVEDHYATVKQDLLSGDRQANKFTAEPPQEITFCSQSGQFYRFKISDSEGKLQQDSIGYLMFDGKRLYGVSTAATFDDPPGFTSLDQLQAFEPQLTRIVSNLKCS